LGTTRRGLTISTDDAAVITAIDDFTDQLAGIRPGVETVLGVTARHPDVAPLQLASSMLWLYGQTAATDTSAAGFVAAAHTLEPSMNDRERATLGALDRWSAHDHLAAAEQFEALVTRWPHDLLALKALEFLYYVLGQQHMGPRFLAQVESIADPNQGDADFLAVWAFASELSGFADRAAELAEASLAIEPRTPWAHHALAHVFITRGDPPAALERLESFLPVWESSGRVIHAHNAWHLAVAHLDRLFTDRALAVHDTHIWGFAPDTPGEQIDAISLLWRVEMAGETVEDARWADVADHVEARVGECVFPFLSAHHGYALARAGRDDAVAALCDTVQRRSDLDDAEARRVWQPIGQRVVDACIAHGRGHLAAAATAFDPVIDEMTAVGGSDAQDDLFRQAYLTALIGAGRTADAQRYWATMTSFKTLSPLDERLGDRC
jgi:hypothetical protein